MPIKFWLENNSTNKIKVKHISFDFSYNILKVIYPDKQIIIINFKDIIRSAESPTIKVENGDPLFEHFDRILNYMLEDECLFPYFGKNKFEFNLMQMFNDNGCIIGFLPESFIERELINENSVFYPQDLIHKHICLIVVNKEKGVLLNKKTFSPIFRHCYYNENINTAFYKNFNFKTEEDVLKKLRIELIYSDLVPATITFTSELNKEYNEVVFNDIYVGKIIDYEEFSEETIIENDYVWVSYTELLTSIANKSPFDYLTKIFNINAVRDYCKLYFRINENELNKESVLNLSSKTKTSTVARDVQLNFWERFSEYLIQNNSPFKCKKPRPQHWCEVNKWHSEIKMSFIISVTQNYIRIDLIIPDNKDLYYRFKKKKEDIERNLGFPFKWDDKPGPKASKISYALKNIDIKETPSHEIAYEWLYNNGLLIYKEFKKLVIV